MRFSAWSSIVIGLLMLTQWLFFLMSGAVPEVRTAPIALSFHLFAEAATAIALITAGALLLRGHRFGVSLGLVANGMLVYTVIVSPGYFAQLGQWPLVGMFAALLVIALISIRRLSAAPQSAAELPNKNVRRTEAAPGAAPQSTRRSREPHSYVRGT